MTSPDRGPRVIAHRGFAATAPENTIRALTSAAAVVDAVEFDVRRCGSGELVVIHDETVDRVTDATGRVAELSLDRLKSLSVCGTDETIPTLEEALAAVPPHVEISLEIKELGLAGDVVEALDGVANRVLVTSFIPDVIDAVRERDPDQPTGLLAGRLLDSPVTTAVELDCQVVGANYKRCLFTRLVSRAHGVDLDVHAWTVERSILAKLLARRGVDAVSCDRPVSI